MWMCCSCGELGKQAACFPVEEDKSLLPSEGETAETFLIPEASPGPHCNAGVQGSSAGLNHDPTAEFAYDME